MNTKPIHFLLAAAIILIAGTLAFNYMEQQAAEEKVIDENRTMAQMEYVSNLRARSERILAADPDVQELMNGTNHLKIQEIIYNESYAEEVYNIGFHYEKRELDRGFKILGGNVYRFAIDLENSSIISIKEEVKPDLYEISIYDVERENSAASVYSLSSIEGFAGFWFPYTNTWLYEFRVSGVGNVEFADDPSVHKSGCSSHNLFINELQNKEQIYYNTLENDPDAIKAWCDNDALPMITNQQYPECLRVKVSYPQDENSTHSLPTKAGFSCYWMTWVTSNETAVFDLDMTFKCIDDSGKMNEIPHDWRIILSSPPSINDLSEDEMKEYGIGSEYGNYYSPNVIFVKKGDWLENVGGVV